MRDTIRFTLPLWIIGCSVLASYFWKRALENMGRGRHPEMAGGLPDDYTDVGKRYYKRFVVTVVVGLITTAVGIVVASG